MSLEPEPRIPLHHYKHVCAVRGVYTVNVQMDHLGGTPVYDLEVTQLKVNHDRYVAEGYYTTGIETEYYSDLSTVTKRFIDLVNQRALTIVEI
jgi:hypothetical protein